MKPWILSLALLLGSLKTFAAPNFLPPIPRPVRPPRDIIVPSEMKYDPTLIRIFDQVELSDHCSRSGIGSDASFRGAQGITGFDVFHDGCGAKVFHEFQTGVAFAGIAGTIFPADIEIQSATLFFRLRENGTAPGTFALERNSEGRVRNHCRMDLFLADRDWTTVSADHLPVGGVFLANAPLLGSANGVFRIDITAKFKDLYFRKIPNLGFIFRGYTPDVITDSNVQCTSLISDMSIKVLYNVPQ